MKLSRTAIEQHINCPRCFYLERKLGLKPPRRIPLTLAVATDALLKNEFDAIRASGDQHALWAKAGLKVRAYDHPDIDQWRNNFQGIRVTHSGVEVYGAVDDVWQDLHTGELIIVDYKSTSKKDTPTLTGGFSDAYKRQMEIYQWLFRQAGHVVSDTGYFLYVNGRKDGGFYQRGTEGVMHFETTLIPHRGDDRWVAAAVDAAIACFNADTLPEPGPECDTCRYFEDRSALMADLTGSDQPDTPPSTPSSTQTS